MVNKTLIQKINRLKFISLEESLRYDLFSIFTALLLSKEFFKKNCEIKDFLNSNGIEIKDYVAKSRTNMLARTLLYINTINIEKMHQINNSLLELIKNNDNNEDDVYIKKILNKYARNGNDE